VLAVSGERYDAVVLGAGPAGEVATGILAEAGLKVALVERELVGGECGYWACIPSKTLLRPPETKHESSRTAGVSTPELDWARVAAYRDWMIRNLDDSGAVSDYEQQGVTVFKSSGKLAGPGRVEVGGQVIETEHVIVATGSEPLIPPIEGLAEAGYWTNREATTLKEIPKSALFIGGGAVGVELAQMLARFGSQVAIVQGADRLLNREDPEVGRLIGQQLEADGIRLELGRQVTQVRVENGERAVVLDDGSELRSEALVVAAGRRPRVAGLGLESVGIEPGAHGIPIDDSCRAAKDVWAIGDATGVSLFTHVGKYQARVATANILGENTVADYRAVPRVVFSDPEVAAVGLTAQQAKEQGLVVSEVRLDLKDAIARPYTYEENPRGWFGLLVDRERDLLVGAWAVAPLAGEWIHHAVLAIRAEIPVAILKDTIAQFPTFSEAYVSALRKLPKNPDTTMERSER
jgi:pyruvate/2-oxoglutarate dehydrogenase complex dihydrolipoamide dehydrogenase (E3) component